MAIERCNRDGLVQSYAKAQRVTAEGGHPLRFRVTLYETVAIAPFYRHCRPVACTCSSRWGGGVAALVPLWATLSTSATHDGCRPLSALITVTLTRKGACCMHVIPRRPSSLI